MAYPNLFGSCHLQHYRSTGIKPAGRPCCPAGVYQFTGGQTTAWVKLDFNDRDNQGNFKLREFHSHMYLEKTFDALPILEKGQEMEKLLGGMRNGERQTIHLMKDGKATSVLVEVNPSLKTVDLYNAKGKKVILSEARKTGFSKQ